MQRHWRLGYKGGRYLWHKKDKEQETEEEDRNHPAGDGVRAEAVAWALAGIVYARIVEKRRLMNAVRHVLRSNALNAKLP